MDHQLIGVLFLSLSHLYLFLLFLNLWLLSDVCLFVCLSVFLSICLSVCWGLSGHSILFLSDHSSDYLPFHLSIYLSFLPFWPLVCLTVCLWVRLYNLSFCPLIDFGLFKNKNTRSRPFFICFSQKLSCQKNIKIGERKLRHKMIKQEIVLI